VTLAAFFFAGTRPVALLGRLAEEQVRRGLDRGPHSLTGVGGAAKIRGGGAVQDAQRDDLLDGAVAGPTVSRRSAKGAWRREIVPRLRVCSQSIGSCRMPPEGQSHAQTRLLRNP